jgi:hypothetical protein
MTRKNSGRHCGARGHFVCIALRASEHPDNVATRYNANSDTFAVTYNDDGHLRVRQDLGGFGNQRVTTQHCESLARIV